MLRKYGRRYYYEIKRKINHWKNLLVDSKPKLLILVYHRILPQVKFNPLYTIISLEAFIKQIDILARKYPVISLRDAINQCQSGLAKSKTQVVLTFDDGYRDNYEIVFPILKQKGLAATFFLVTDYIDSNRPLWDWEIITIVNNDKTINCVRIEDKIIYQKDKESRLFFALRVFDKMKSMNTETRQKIIDFLKDNSKNNLLYGYTKDSCITWEQARKMSQDGMEIGNHSISHGSLSKIPLDEAKYEIRKSKEVIENNIKKPCIHFAFPFGSQRDYNQNLLDCVKNVGFRSCLLNIHGYNHIKRDSFCFKRIIMEEFTDLKYLLG